MRTIQRGQIYIAGRRPMLILQSDGPEIIAVPTAELFRHSSTLMDQIKTVDGNRLGRYICRLSSTKMNEVERALHACLGIYYEGRVTV